MLKKRLFYEKSIRYLQHKDGLYICALVAIWMLINVVIGPVPDVPINDDCRYAYPVKSLIETGRLTTNIEFAPNLLFQIAWGYLFCLVAGFSFSTLRFSTLTIGVVGILFLYRILKKNGASPGFAFILCLIGMINPLFFSLANSFMTDVPFLSLCIISLFYYQEYFRTRKLRHLITGAVFSILAFWIRHPGIVFLFVVATILVVSQKPLRNWRRGASLFAAGLLIYFLTEWSKDLLGIQSSYVSVNDEYVKALIHAPLLSAARIGMKFIILIIMAGLYLLPVAPMVNGLFRVDRRWHVIIVASNVLMMVIFARAPIHFPYGYVMMGYGPERVFLKDVCSMGLANVPSLLQAFLYGLTFIGQLCGTYLTLALVRHLKTNLSPFVVTLLLTSILYLSLMALTSFYDRYLLFPVFVLIILLPKVLHDTFASVPYKIIPVCLVCALAWVSICSTKDYMAWRTAHLHAFNWSMQRGISIKEMDAGAELNGWYNGSRNFKQSDSSKSWWWVDDDTYALTMGSIKGYKAIAQFPFFRCLNFSQGTIYVLQRSADTSRGTTAASADNLNAAKRREGHSARGLCPAEDSTAFSE